MGRSLRLVCWATMAGLAAAAVGVAIVVGQSLSETLANPEWSLADGYWRGRLPWMAVGVALAITGASVAVLFGTLCAWLVGGAVRWVVSALALAMAAFWWFVAMPLPPQGGPCQTCQPPGPEPMAMAYSQPEVAGLVLVLPAVIVGLVALSRRAGRSSR